MSGEKRRPPPPLLGDGSIVGDYTLLYTYWRVLQRRGLDLEDAMLKHQDFRLLRQLVESESRLSLEELLERLTNHFVARVNREAAREACREVYGVELPDELAARKIARMLAGWLVEAGKQYKILKLEGPRLPPD